MIYRKIYAIILLCLFMIAASQSGYAQDRVYTNEGKVLEGKVTEVGPTQIRFIQRDRPDGLVYYLKVSQLDSIVYGNGTKDEMQGVVKKRKILENIPQLNTWTFDLLGFTYLSVSQSYERRTKNGKIGFRVPVYVGFIGGGFAGEGIFQPGQGVYPLAGNSSGGFSIATGFNPKFYFFKRRRVRAFAGPEATIGYTKSSLNSYNYYYSYSVVQKNGTVGLIGKVGLMINPIDKFNITIDGGAGGGNMFGANGLGWVGLWHIGLSIGTNF
jgi:hypothetical protein